jgi:putative transcriptional regulator
MENLISYEPLFKTLKEKDMNTTDLRENKVLYSNTIAKFQKGESMELESVEKICKYLKVPIEKVVNISYGD